MIWLKTATFLIGTSGISGTSFTETVLPPQATMTECIAYLDHLQLADSEKDVKVTYVRESPVRLQLTINQGTYTILVGRQCIEVKE